MFDRPLETAELDRIRTLIGARGRHVPVAYLTGEKEFFSLAFHVDENVLVPRPETEHLVETALVVLQEADAPVLADIGTGCGCIAVALLHEVPSARGHATDLSEAALSVARRNAERHGVLDRLVLHAGDLLEPLRGTDDWGRLDVVVSNPPYVLESDETVEHGVRAHEPKEALFVPGSDPLAVARRVAGAAREALRPGGLLVFEVGMGSAPGGKALLADLGYEDLTVGKDLAGIDRVVAGRRPPATGT